MGKVRHGCVTTKHAIRAAIHRSPAATAALSGELSILTKMENRNHAEPPHLNWSTVIFRKRRT